MTTVGRLTFHKIVFLADEGEPASGVQAPLPCAKVNPLDERCRDLLASVHKEGDTLLWLIRSQTP
jgi:hypothetical protein